MRKGNSSVKNMKHKKQKSSDAICVCICAYLHVAMHVLCAHMCTSVAG